MHFPPLLHPDKLNILSKHLFHEWRHLMFCFRGSANLTSMPQQPIIHTPKMYPAESQSPCSKRPSCGGFAGFFCKSCRLNIISNAEQFHIHCCSPANPPVLSNFKNLLICLCASKSNHSCLFYNYGELWLIELKRHHSNSCITRIQACYNKCATWCDYFLLLIFQEIRRNCLSSVWEHHVFAKRDSNMICEQNKHWAHRRLIWDFCSFALSQGCGFVSLHTFLVKIYAARDRDWYFLML